MCKVFANRTLRTFELKRDAVTGKLGKQHNEELYDLESTPNIIRLIKSIKMIRAHHVARMGR